MDCRTPGFPVRHQLWELTQTHVHLISDAIQPSHLLSSLFLQASVFPTIRVFSNKPVLCISWPKYWNFSFSISPSNGYLDWFPLGLTALIYLQSKGLSSVSPTPQFKSISSSVLSFLYGLTFTSIHDYWKKHSFD